MTEPTAAAINIMTTNLADNGAGPKAARLIANDTWDSVMATTTRHSPVKHRQPIKVRKAVVVKTPAPAKSVVKTTSVFPNKLISQLEESLNLRLVAFGQKLLADFDLSREGLAHVTEGKYLALLSDKTGESKTGGDKSRTGNVKFERYISVRYKDCMVKFACLLLDPTDPKGVRFQVEGAQEHFPRAYKQIYELRPYLPHGAKVGANKGGWEYSSFDKAGEKFTQIIASFAHRKH